MTNRNEARPGRPGELDSEGLDVKFERLTAMKPGLVGRENVAVFTALGVYGIPPQ